MEIGLYTFNLNDAIEDLGDLAGRSGIVAQTLYILFQIYLDFLACVFILLVGGTVVLYVGCNLYFFITTTPEEYRDEARQQEAIDGYLRLQIELINLCIRCTLLPYGLYCAYRRIPIRRDRISL